MRLGRDARLCSIVVRTSEFADFPSQGSLCQSPW